MSNAPIPFTCDDFMAQLLGSRDDELKELDGIGVPRLDVAETLYPCGFAGHPGLELALRSSRVDA